MCARHHDMCYSNVTYAMPVCARHHDMLTRNSPNVWIGFMRYVTLFLTLTLVGSDS